MIRSALEDLEDILDENVDEGAEPKQVFASIAEFCA